MFSYFTSDSDFIVHNQKILSGERPAAKQARACRAGKHPLAYNLFVHIRNIILHPISAKISVFFRSIAKEKVSALPKRKLRGKR